MHNRDTTASTKFEKSRPRGVFTTQSNIYDGAFLWQNTQLAFTGGFIVNFEHISHLVLVFLL